MSFGFDGLSSGIDSTGIINQLMQLERQPAVRLENRTKQNQQAVTALGSLKTSLAAVSAAAKALNDPLATFVPRVASSSGTHVTASASGSADAGSMTFVVDRLASRHAMVSLGSASSRDAVVNASGADVTMQITVGATTHDLTVVDGTTLRQLTEQINAAAGLDVTASLVDTGSGVKLQLSSDSNGAAGVFTADLSQLDAAAFGGTTDTGLLTQGADAAITVGKGSAGEYSITSTTNTFNDLIKGLSFTVTAVKPEEVTVAVAADPAALTAKVKSFVDAVNSALGEMDKQLKSGLNGTAGALAGNSTIRQLRDRLIDSVTYPVAGSSLKSSGMVGIQSSRTGTLEFNTTKFTAALTADPDAVQALFKSADKTKPGIADRVMIRADEATKANTGILATVVKSRETENKTFASMIEGIDRRIALRRATMQRQFANLEVVMGNLQSQQSWMASQIGSMNANAG